jgi:hypothetical protein
LYPNPNNCNSFIQCVPQPDGSGKPKIMPCPTGLEWNDNKKQCDWPQDSTCGNKPINTPTAAPTQAPTQAPTYAPTNPPDNGFQCPRADIVNTGCKGPKDCLYPNPNNCNSFIQCVPQPDGSGKPQLMPCPADLKWNDNKKQCDWPQDSTCGNKPINAPTAAPTQAPTQAPTHAPTNPPDNGFQCPRADIANTGCKGPIDCLYPNPENCNSFIQCVPQIDGSGKPQVIPCPGDLEWNDNQKQCDWPQNYLS